MSLKIGLLAILLIHLPVANAALVTFTDRTTWQAAAGGGPGNIFENFNSITTDVGYGVSGTAVPPVTVGYLTLEVINGFADGSWQIDSPPHQIFTSVNGTASATALGINNTTIGFGDTLMSFSPVSALGFDYAGTVYSNEPGTITTNLGGSIIIPLLPDGELGFIGFLYTAGETFTSLEWGVVDSPVRNSEQFGMSLDDVEAFGAVIPIPVPATLWLFGTALIGLISINKRRKTI